METQPDSLLSPYISPFEPKPVSKQNKPNQEAAAQAASIPLLLLPFFQNRGHLYIHIYIYKAFEPLSFIPIGLTIVSSFPSLELISPLTKLLKWFNSFHFNFSLILPNGFYSFEFEFDSSVPKLVMCLYGLPNNPIQLSSQPSRVLLPLPVYFTLPLLLFHSHSHLLRMVDGDR